MQVESAGLTFVFMVSKCLTLAYYAFLPLLTQYILGNKLSATLSKKNLLSHLYWGTQCTMEIS